MKKKTDLIDEDKQQFPTDTIGVLIKKSSVAGETDTDKQKIFKTFIRNAYIHLQQSLNDSTKVIMEIVANVPNVKIIYLPNEVNIREYKEDSKKPLCKTTGITYVKTEKIIIAAKGYYKKRKKNYNKFLGVIIHEFCHFAVHETFGNGFKPYYADDKVAAERWKKLVDQYQSSDLDKFPVMKDLFASYENETKWVDELVVRYPQIYVENNGNHGYLKKFKNIFIDLLKIYTEVQNEFKSEKEKTESLRTVNAKTLLGDEESKLNVNSLVIEKEKAINFDANRQIVKTNQTYLVMKYIFNCFKDKLHFKSKFMFIKVKFLEENIELIKKALQCKKVTKLIIDCHDEVFKNQDIQHDLCNLFNSILDGHIILILHSSQVFCLETREVEVIFETSDLNAEFKGSLEIDFQGTKMHLRDLIQSEKFDDVFNVNEYLDGFLSESKILIGHQQNDKLIGHYVERCFEIKQNDVWEKIEMTESQRLRSLFAKNNCLILSNESGDGKSTVSIRINERMKDIFPDHWVVLMNLSNYTESLNKIDHKTTPDEFFSMTILKEKMHYERTIFLKLIQEGKVFFIFDSLDEVCPKHLQSVNGLVEELERKNKIFILTRPFALNIWKKRNFVQIRLSELDIDSINELVTNVLESEVGEVTDSFQNRKKKIIEFLYENDLKTPLLITIVTAVFSKLDTFSNLHGVYEMFIQKIHDGHIGNKKSKVVTCDTIGKNRKFYELLKEFAFKNNLCGNDKDQDCLKIDKKKFAGHFYSKQDIKTLNFPILRSGILRERQNSEFEFVHKTFEVYFVATFMRDNCKKICEDDRYLNILCLVASNLESNDRLKDLIEFLKGSDDVEDLKKKLSVFNQLLSDKEIGPDDVDISPVSIELSKQEKSLRVKYLIRFKDPVKKLDRVKLKTLAQCGLDLPIKYFVSFKCFEEHFLRNKFLNKDVSEVNSENLHIIADFAESLNILSNNPCERIIQLFLEQH